MSGMAQVELVKWTSVSPCSAAAAGASDGGGDSILNGPGVDQPQQQDFYANWNGETDADGNSVFDGRGFHSSTSQLNLSRV